MFTEQGIQMQPQASKDGAGLSAALSQVESSLRTLRRSTGIYGADERLQLSLNALNQLAKMEADQAGRKLVLWVSPGWPLLSGPNVAELTEKQEQQIFSNIVSLSDSMRAAKLTLYALDSLGAEESISRTGYYQNFVKGVARPRDAGLGNLALQVLATQTGGLVLNSNEITGLLTRCVKDASAYYEITFTPPPEHKEQHNIYHQIEVKVSRPGLVARTLHGYYSNP
jgi:VWFA-related protein